MDFDEAKDIASQIMNKWGLENKVSKNDSLLNDIATTILRTYKVGAYGIKNRLEDRSREIGERLRASRRTSRKKPEDSD